MIYERVTGSSVLDAFKPVKQAGGIEIRGRIAPLFGTRPPSAVRGLMGLSASACLDQPPDQLQPTGLRGIPSDLW